MLALSPGLGSGGGAKRWPPEGFGSEGAQWVWSVQGLVLKAWGDVLVRVPAQGPGRDPLWCGLHGTGGAVRPCPGLGAKLAWAWRNGIVGTRMGRKAKLAVALTVRLSSEDRSEALRRSWSLNSQEISPSIILSSKTSSEAKGSYKKAVLHVTAPLPFAL